MYVFSLCMFFLYALASVVYHHFWQHRVDTHVWIFQGFRVKFLGEISRPRKFWKMTRVLESSGKWLDSWKVLKLKVGAMTVKLCFATFLSRGNAALNIYSFNYLIFYLLSSAGLKPLNRHREVSKSVSQSESADVTCWGRLFQIWAVATRKAWSPTNGRQLCTSDTRQTGNIILK